VVAQEWPQPRRLASVSALSSRRVVERGGRILAPESERLQAVVIGGGQAGGSRSRGRARHAADHGTARRSSRSAEAVHRDTRGVRQCGGGAQGCAATVIATLCPSCWVADDRPERGSSVEAATEPAQSFRAVRAGNRPVSQDDAGPSRRMEHEPGQIVNSTPGVGRPANEAPCRRSASFGIAVPALPLAGRPDSITPSC
jgi:hypothetical protein